MRSPRMRRSESQRGRPGANAERRERAWTSGSERGKAGVSVERRVKGGVTVTAGATVEERPLRAALRDAKMNRPLGPVYRSKLETRNSQLETYFAALATFTPCEAAAYRAIPRYKASAICSRYPSLRNFCSSVGLETNETSARIPGIAVSVSTT